jgi:alpha-tubulin suppressor-like RCC1 family protein
MRKTDLGSRSLIGDCSSAPCSADQEQVRIVTEPALVHTEPRPLRARWQFALCALALAWSGCGDDAEEPVAAGGEFTRDAEAPGYAVDAWAGPSDAGAGDFGSNDESPDVPAADAGPSDAPPPTTGPRMPKPLGASVPVTPAVAAGKLSSFALRRDGTVLAWGDRQGGRLGDGVSRESSTRYPQPVMVDGVRALDAGDYHGIALRVDGSVVTWGQNDRGQLGIGVAAPFVSAPTLVPGLADIVAVAAAGHHTLALRKDGALFAWGEGYLGVLGLGDSLDRAEPTQVPGLGIVRAIATGLAHSLAVDDQGFVFAWGSNLEGQLGLGSTVPAFSLNALQVSKLSNVREVAAGDAHSLALLTDGTTAGWGRSDQGQTGVKLATSVGFGTAGEPFLTELRDIVAIAAGANHSLALHQTGLALSWGHAGDGRRGDGSNGVTDSNFQAFAVQTPEPGVVTSFAAGAQHSLFLMDDGSVLCAGSSFFSQCGAIGLGENTYPSPIADGVNVLR